MVKLLVDDYVRGFWEGFAIGQDPNNLVRQACKARSADPAEGGDLTATLGRITVKATVVAFTGDVMFSPEASRRSAEQIAGAEYREVSTTSGHLATFATMPDDRQAMDEAIRDTLAA